jgi:hypothetical protein
MGERKQERHRPDEVRGQLLQQQRALPQRFPYEREVALLEVAKSAVDELAGPARRTRRVVAGLHHAHRQTSGRCVERGAGAGDAAADDQDVEGLRRHPGQGFAALLGTQLG